MKNSDKMKMVLQILSSFCYNTFAARSPRLFNLFLIGQKFWKAPSREFPFLKSGNHSATLLYPKYYNEVEFIQILDCL